MSNILNNIYLINTTHSQEKIRVIFERILSQYDIEGYSLSSQQINEKSTDCDNLEHDIKLEFSQNSIFFSYKLKDDSSKTLLDEEELKILVLNYVIACEHSLLYKNISKGIVGQEALFGGIQKLIKDIEKEIDVYTRYGKEFCLIKVVPNKSIIKEKESTIKVAQKINDSIRNTDEIYIDNKTIYVLLRAIQFKDAEQVAKKIKSSIKNVNIGVVEWQNSYVIADLFSELENYMYISLLKNNKAKPALEEELNKILDKATMFNQPIAIASLNENEIEERKYIEMEFTHNKKKYAVLKKYPNTKELSNPYIFNYRDLASDVLNKLR